MLYELLTGTTPLERERLRAAGYAEILRRIREEEPPKPSTRLSASGEKLASIAATRGTEPSRLARTVRGDLDWIVMKALEKDRARRYESASGLARDIERHLAGDPVEACPPCFTYRLRKFTRKHRASLATALAFAALLVASTAIGTWQALRARAAQAATLVALLQSEAARRQAETVSTFGIEIFRSPDPALDGRQVKVVDVLDRAADKLAKEFNGPAETKGALLGALGETFYGLGLYDRAIALQTQACGVREAALGPDHPLTLLSRIHLGEAYHLAGRTADEIALNEATLKLCEARLGARHPDTLTARNNLAAAYMDAGRIPEAIALDEVTLKERGKALGHDHPHTLNSRNNLAAAYLLAGRHAEAIALDEVNLKVYLSQLGPEHPATLMSRNNLAAAYMDAGRATEAVTLNEANLALCESKLGPEHPNARKYHSNLAMAYLAAGQLAQAEPLLRTVVERAREKPGPGELRLDHATANLGLCLFRGAKWTEAETVLRESLALREQSQPEGWEMFDTKSLLGGALRAQGRYADAEPLVVSGYEGMKAHEAAIPPRARGRVSEAGERVVQLYQAWGKPDQAAQWRAKLGQAELPEDVFSR
jgi:hypothetical protein